MLVKITRVETTRAIRPSDALRIYRTDIELTNGDVVTNIMVPYPNLAVGQVFYCEYDAVQNRYVKWKEKKAAQQADFVQRSLDLGAD